MKSQQNSNELCIGNLKILRKDGDAAICSTDLDDETADKLYKLAKEENKISIRELEYQATGYPESKDMLKKLTVGAFILQILEKAIPENESKSRTKKQRKKSKTL